jgi:hypothetical protein
MTQFTTYHDLKDAKKPSGISGAIGNDDGEEVMIFEMMARLSLRGKARTEIEKGWALGKQD